MKKEQNNILNNKNIKQILFFIFGIFFFTSCTSNDDIIILKINKIIIDHVVEKREGCRFKRIYLIIEITNDRKKPETLNIKKLSDNCLYSISNPSLFLYNNNKSYGLALAEKHAEKFSVAPKERLVLKCVLLTQVKGNSLSEIYNNYKDFFNSNLSVKTDNLTNKVKVKMLNNTKPLFIFLLDDKKIMPNDSIYMHKFLNYLPDTLSNVKIPVIDIEIKEEI